MPGHLRHHPRECEQVFADLSSGASQGPELARLPLSVAGLPLVFFILPLCSETTEINL